MKKDSIIFAITVTFIISILLITVSFTVLYKSSQQREHHYMKKGMSDATQLFFREFRRHGITKELREGLKSMNFSLITNATEISRVLNDKELIRLHVRSVGRANFEHIRVKNRNYVHIDTPRGEVLLLNNNRYESNQTTIIVISLLVLSAFIFLYMTTIKKLKPLRELKRKVEGFGNEEFEIDCATTKQDEISLLANEFNESAKKLKSLKESRNIFIRNIMHELKTPITKGKFLAQLEDSKENNEKMQKVFYRLEALINEFASIEELLSSKKELKRKLYHLEDIVDNAMDILMCSEEQVSKEYNNIQLEVDFKLFSLAIKNLLDNAIKYSEDSRVLIKNIDKKILFENSGKALEYPLESYYEPFFKGENVKSNQSFGLGLYIIKHILDANGYKLEYIYEDSINRFTLTKF